MRIYTQHPAPLPGADSRRDQQPRRGVKIPTAAKTDNDRGLIHAFFAKSNGVYRLYNYTEIKENQRIIKKLALFQTPCRCKRNILLRRRTFYSAQNQAYLAL